MTQKKNNRPQIEFRAGGITGAVWTETAVVDGRVVPQHSIRIEKRYRDARTGEWKATGYLRTEDLPRVGLIASKLFEHLTLREAGASLGIPQEPPEQPSREESNREDETN